jgi:primase-polymerase (primpol)-like protein
VRYSADKVPLRLNGRNASSTSPGTWAAYAAARDSSTGAGLGFVLDDNGIACIDLDHCLAGGRLAPWAAEILAALPPTYVEVSPSGTGLHVWGYGTVGIGQKIRRDDGACIEVYDRGRYMTVTGNRWQRSPSVLADLDGVIASF